MNRPLDQSIVSLPDDIAQRQRLLSTVEHAQHELDDIPPFYVDSPDLLPGAQELFEELREHIDRILSEERRALDDSRRFRASDFGMNPDGEDTSLLRWPEVIDASDPEIEFGDAQTDEDGADREEDEGVPLTSHEYEDALLTLLTQASADGSSTDVDDPDTDRREQLRDIGRRIAALEVRDGQFSEGGDERSIETILDEMNQVGDQVEALLAEADRIGGGETPEEEGNNNDDDDESLRGEVDRLPETEVSDIRLLIETVPELLMRRKDLKKKGYQYVQQAFEKYLRHGELWEEINALPTAALSRADRTLMERLKEGVDLLMDYGHIYTPEDRLSSAEGKCYEAIVESGLKKRSLESAQESLNFFRAFYLDNSPASLISSTTRAHFRALHALIFYANEFKSALSVELQVTSEELHQRRDRERQVKARGILLQERRKGNHLSKEAALEQASRELDARDNKILSTKRGALQGRITHHIESLVQLSTNGATHEEYERFTAELQAAIENYRGLEDEGEDNTSSS